MIGSAAEALESEVSLLSGSQQRDFRKAHSPAAARKRLMVMESFILALILVRRVGWQAKSCFIVTDIGLNYLSRY